MKRLWRKLRQAVDRAIYEGRFKQFLWLGGVFLLIFGIMLLLAWGVGFDSEANPNRALRILELMMDPGSFAGAYVDGHVWLQFAMVILGTTFFSSFLIGAIGNLLSRRIESIESGQYSYDFDGHVVILGSSSMLMSVLKQIKGLDKDIVIQTDGDVEQVRDLIMSNVDGKLMKNIYVVFGKRTNKASLEDLRIAHAESIYIIGEDDEPQHDGVNLECWHVITEICAGGKDVKNCYLVLDRLTTHNIFTYRPTVSRSTDNLRLNVISVAESMAQGVLVSGQVQDIKYPALDRDGINKDSDVNVHLVIVGMTQVAYAMAMTAAHICHFPNFITKNKKTKITFIQKNIKEELDFWMGHFDPLMDLSYAEVISWNEKGTRNVRQLHPKAKYLNPACQDSSGFLDVEWEFIDAGVEDEHVRNYIRECVAKDGVSEYLSFAVCGREAEGNVAASLYLPKEVFMKNEIPVYVYQPLTRWVLSTAKGADFYSNLYPFGMRTECFDPQQERLLWAKRIKFIYDTCGQYEAMPSMEELDKAWYHEDDTYIRQQSNIYSANSVPVKFRSIGMNPLDGVPMTSDEIALLAEVEHNRWTVERLIAGYSAIPYAKREQILRGLQSEDESVAEAAKKEKNELKEKFFQHIDIAPYDELMPATKQYDINIVKNLLDVIRS